MNHPDRVAVDIVGSLGEHVTMTPTALILAPDASRVDWEVALVGMARAHNASVWYIGDLLVAGEERFGLGYDEAERITGYERTTLYEYKRRAKAVDPSIRMEGVGISFYGLIAKFPTDQQRELLTLISEHGWTRAQLTEHVRSIEGVETPEPEEDPAKLVARLQNELASVIEERDRAWVRAGTHIRCPMCRELHRVEDARIEATA
jgi:hypothetical protein